MLHLKSDIGNRGLPLAHKPFTIYNAGLYDFSLLKQSSWDLWRANALELFQCRDEPHDISGVPLDGYRGLDDVLVFNHTLDENVVLDYGFIDNLHSLIGSAAGSRFFIIAPAASIAFLEDYVEKDTTRYYILRIPYSIINELHSRDFEAILQPSGETQINEIMEAVGFDFIRRPKVECVYFVSTDKEYKEAIIGINVFLSKAMAKGASLKQNLETLSMVLVDYDYPLDTRRKGKEAPPPFELDTVFFADNLAVQNWEVRIPFNRLGEYTMLIYVDIYGNEYTEVKAQTDFGIAEIKGVNLKRGIVDA